jgi:E3 SUMO-protein ligase RanBP2
MLGRKEAALQSYTTSLRLDPKQNNLVLKVCELLASDDVEMDQSGAKHFCELAQSFDPHNPAIFDLKQRILTTQNDDPRDVSNLILRELEMRPTDVKLRVRLLKHLMQHHVKEAYKHASDVEAKDLAIFHNNLAWYETVAEVLVRYQRTVSLPDSLGWEFWFLSVSVLDKLVSLTLAEHSENVKITTEYVNALFNFDQTLAKASLNVGDCPDKHFLQQFLNHYSSQLCFHMATLVFKQAQKDLIKYKEASNTTLPLLFASYHSQPPDLQSMWFNHAPEARRNLVRKWRKEAAFRCSQAGHILQAAAKDRKSIIIEKATQYSMGMWREQLFKKLFVTRDQQLKMKTSYFLTDQQLFEITLRVPESGELLKYDEEAQLIFPDSLHHHIWIALNNKLSDLKCTVFDGLQYSVKNLKNCGAETLNVLDVQAFIYCATLCAKFSLENTRLISYYNLDKPNMLPAAVTQQLGTLNQNIFFKAAYRMYKNEYDSAVDQLRLTLVDGIRILRCVDNGLDVKLLVTLAKTFAERSKNSTKQSEVEANEARAELYWKSALPILEKMKNNQAVSYPPNKLFNYRSKDMSLTEICSHIEIGKLFSGTQLMKKKEYERALRIFESLKDPYASFYQAQIYKHMADQQTSQNKESVTSEMRSQNIILLSRARDCLYLTLDRLREPSVDQKHPLNEQLGTEIEKIERLLSRIDPDCTNRNECDGMSDENVSSADSTGDHYVTGYTAHNSTYFNGLFSRGDHPNNHSTPYRSDIFKREAKPSPERLDAQLRQLTASKDAAINHILEHNKIMVESHRTLVDELRSFKEAVNNLTSTVEELKGMKHSYEELKDIKKSVNELKSSIDELDNFKSVSDMVFEMKKEIAELKKDINKTSQLTDEDIYGLANDYGTDYNINSNLAAYNTNLYQNYQARLPGAPSLYGPPPLYPGMYPPMYYGGLGLPQTGSGLQFGSEQQLAGISGQDFRTISAALSQVQPTVTYGQPLSQTTVPPTTLGVSLLTGQGLAQTIPTPVQSNLFRDPKITATTNTSASVFPAVSVTAAKAPPVNVVITTSDPLPSTKTSVSQPVLSVTIPPQHLKGNIPKAQPHNYQIPLPTSTVPNTSPSVLSKPPPAISTQSLLSNVAAPVYSAVADKTPMNVSLGLQIEKSLEQTFNSSKNDSVNKSNVSTTSQDEHDPCPDFKPIIPLPDEVPVTTGEENETVLFCERAKLYRYVTESKEWRERGIGRLKILKNPETKKIRILMRRDQVLKICANHFMTKDMVLTAMAKSDRAYIWAAHDYADEEVVLEKLCVKFKNPEEAKKFHDAFESARKELESAQVETKEKPGASKESEMSKPQASLGGFVFSSTPTFKPKADPVTPIVVQADSPKVSPFSGFSFGTKTGSTAQFPSFQCNFTPVQKQNETTPSSSVSSVAAKDEKVPADDDKPDEFVPTAEFKPVVPLPKLVEVKTGEEDCEVLFESRAKLLRFDTSGETKEWKEKGLGTIKLLKDKSAHIVRLVMRREQVLKVCCNHQLLKTMEFKVMSNNPKALTWCAKDFSEGVIKPEAFAIRFKTEELASSFLKAITTAQESLDENNCVVNKHPEKHLKTESPPKPVISFGDSSKQAKGSWECKNCYVVNDGRVNYCVACDTPKNDTVPKKNDNDASGAAFSFGVPNMGAVTNSWGSAFKPKEGSWECKSCYIRNDADKTHCISCESPKDDSVPKKEANKGVDLDTGGLEFSFGIQPTKPATTQGAPATTQRPPTGWGDLFKPIEGTWECKVCLIRNFADAVQCVACDTPKGDVEASDVPKGINLDTPGQKYTFGFPTTTAGSKATFSFGQNVSIFGDPSTTTATDAPFVFKPAASVASTEKKDTSVTEKFVFGSPQKHDFEFTPRSPRRISSGAKDDESDASYVEEECDNIYFKPVIPLPDKIDVKTGEEEEDVLYCHRAKLFRFVSGEWKERGLGDIKILKRRDNGKLRVLMRREQIFKICLNHVLTSDVKYMPKDAKTWLFSAPDYSEGELTNEQFCVRFKNAEIAQEFLKAVNDALGGASSDTGKEPDQKTEEDGVEFVSETKVTPEEEKEAIRLGLPPKYLAYRQLSDCQCEQCKKDDEYLKDLLEPAESTATIKSVNQIFTAGSLSSSSSSSSVFSTPRGEGSVFTTPREEVFSFKSSPDVSAAPATTLKGLLSKPSLLVTPKLTGSGFSSSPLLSSASSSNAAFVSPSTTTSAFGSKSGSSFFQTPTDLSKNESGTSVSSVFSVGGTHLTSSSSTPSILGSSATITSSAGATKSGGIFGTSLFGKPIFGSGTTTPAFGGSTTTTTPIFGAATTTPTTPIFGGATTTPTFGGTTNTTTPIFGAATTTSTTPIFGGATTAPTTTPIFGSKPTIAPTFGGTTTTAPHIFGGTTTTAPIFGSATTTTAPIFGGTTTTSQSTLKTPSSGIFGAALKSDATPSTTSASLFKTTGSLFGAPATTTGSIFGGPPVALGKSNEGTKTIFGGGNSFVQSAESPVRPLFGATSQITVADAKTVNLKEEDAAVLDCSSGVSFAALAANVSTEAPPAFVKDKNDSNKTPFAFLGAGAPVFGSRGNDSKNKSASEDAEEGGGGDEEYDPHYDPIVPLPDTIVVSTGEEDEEALFNERAKLFRYDSNNKEWKERGVGQMKILHHPVNNTYRFLLRREQVHKVVLNQLILSDLELQPMKTSDKAWVWAGYNYTDDDSALEQLAIRFKNCDLAQNFHKIVQEVISKVKQVQTEKVSIRAEPEQSGDQVKDEEPAVGEVDASKFIPSTIQNYGVEDVSSDEQGAAREASYGEEEDDDDEDDEDEDDDDRTVMFMKRCTLSEQLNGEWKTVTLGDLQVYYDPDLYAARICVNNDSGEIVSNTLIGVNTVMEVSWKNGGRNVSDCVRWQVEKNHCVWKGVEWSSGPIRHRTLKATFSSVAAAQEFNCNYLEGLNYAQEFDVVDEIPAATEEETESLGH